MQKKFEDCRAVFGKQTFELVDLLVARPPERFGDEVLDPHYQNVFVVRAVEETDHAISRHPPVYPPKKIVR